MLRNVVGGVTIVVASIAHLTGALNASDLSIRWSATLGLSDLAQIDQRLEAVEPKLSGQPAELLHRTNGTIDNSVRVNTCAAFLNAVAKGYVAESTFAVNQESYLIAHCFVLQD